MENIRMIKIKCPHEHISNGEVLALSKDRRSIISLNQSSFFLWDNCNHKTLTELTRFLISKCNDADSLDFDSVYRDNQNAITVLEKNGLIRLCRQEAAI